MKEPGPRLAEWRKTKSVSFRKAAILFSCAPSQIIRFESGDRTPSLAVAFAMEDETGIPARHWIKKK